MGKDVTDMGRNVTDMGCEKKEEKKELKKHAATIHCSNTLSLLQRKIANALLYHAYPELMLKEEHEITVRELCRLIGYQGHNHAVIKGAFKGLISTIIEWNVTNDEIGGENWSASSIIASVSLEGPLCFYAYSPRMKQLLHSPSMFGKIDLVIQSRFRSSYGLALYENCIRYRGLAQTKWFEIELFKKLMGVPTNKYDVFRDFKRRVLDKAIEEVNTYSDLVIESEFIREGRKVRKVRFKLKERAKKMRLGNKKLKEIESNQSHLQLTTKLLNTFGMSKEQVKGLFNEYGIEYIENKITMIEASKSFKNDKVQNLAGYLLSAIRQNYQPAKAEQSKVIDMQNAKQELELSDLKFQIEAMRAEYIAYREKMIHSAIDGLTMDAKNKLMQHFAVFAEPVIKTILQLQRKKYSRENVYESPQIKALLRQFALREIDILNLVSLEEFVSQLDNHKVKAWQKLKSYNPDHPLLKFQEN